MCIRDSFTGSTVHEVAHVVGAANAMGAEVSNNAIIVKMIRVMMLVPVLLVIAGTVARDVAKRDNLENADINKDVYKRQQLDCSSKSFFHPLSGTCFHPHFHYMRSYGK